MTAAAERAARWAEAAERRPALSWILALTLVVAMVGWEASYWPRHDFPGALWHNANRGIEIEVVQARAARVGWKELKGYWVGRLIHGNDYYQPLTSWLFVGEYHLFKKNDRLWARVNIALHLANCLLLVWATTVFTTGPLLQRLVTGVLAALLLGGPRLADRNVQMWILGWWPCQPDLLSVFFGLLLLSAVALYCRTGRLVWAVLAPLFFFIAICFKETGYVAGLGGCLLLVRHPKRWPLLAVLAVQGLSMYAFRWNILGGPASFNPEDLARLRNMVSLTIAGTVRQLSDAAVHFGFLGAGLAATWALRRRLGRVERGLVVAAVYGGLALVVLGPPWETLFQIGFRALLSLALLLLLAAGVLLAFRQWPVPELFGIFIFATALGYCYPAVLAWHFYWGQVFQCLAVAIALAAVAERIWRVAAARTGAPELAR